MHLIRPIVKILKKDRRLKRYWKLLLKKESELSHTDYKFYPMFGQRLEVNIVREMLNYDTELKPTMNSTKSYYAQ